MVRSELARRDQIDRAIAALSVPATLALLTEPAYDLTDIALVATLGSSEVGGVAIAQRILMLGQSLFIFMTFSTTAAVARTMGARLDRDAAQIASTALRFAAAIGVASATVLWFGIDTVLGAFNAEPDVISHARNYLRISVVGIPFVLITMAGIGIARGLKDTVTPLKIAAGSVLLNVVVESMLIVVMGFGTGASALSTVIAKIVSCGLFVLYVRAFTGKHDVSPSLITVRDLGIKGAPLVLRTAFLIGTLTWITALAADSSTATLTAFALVFTLWQFFVYAYDGVEVAAQTLFAEAIGKRSSTDLRLVVKRVLRYSMLLSVGVGVLMYLAVWGYATVVAPSDAVKSLAVGVACIVAIEQLAASLAFSTDGFLVGSDRTLSAAVGMGVACVGAYGARIVLFAGSTTLTDIWLIIGVFVVLRAFFGLAITAHEVRQLEQTAKA